MSGILQNQSGYVLTLSINNPERRNAISAAMLQALLDIVRAIDPKKVRALVLRGAGDKAFCSGYDLTALPGNAQQGADFKGPALLSETCQAICDCPVPTIAALKGSCFGAGGELAISCDLRLAAEDVKFAMPPAKLGIVYAQQGLARFVRTVGMAVTKEIFFAGATWEVGDLLRIGLINRRLPTDRFFAEVASAAEQIAANAPLAVQSMKRIIDAVALNMLTPQQHSQFDALRLQAFQSADYREGVQAMAQKRPPVFKGE